MSKKQEKYGIDKQKQQNIEQFFKSDNQKKDTNITNTQIHQIDKKDQGIDLFHMKPYQKQFVGRYNYLKYIELDQNGIAVKINGFLKISVHKGDITAENVDAITNAANNELWLGGGVAGAIRNKGGPIIQRECDEYTKKHGKVETGQCAITSGGNMLCKYVIHTVGPIWSHGKKDDPKLLYWAVFNTLMMATKKNCKSVSIPAISSGIFGFPKPLCAQVMFSAAEDFAIYFDQEGRGFSLENVRFTNFDQETYEIFINELLMRYLNIPKEFESKFYQSNIQENLNEIDMIKNDVEEDKFEESDKDILESQQNQDVQIVQEDVQQQQQEQQQEKKQNQEQEQQQQQEKKQHQEQQQEQEIGQEQQKQQQQEIQQEQQQHQEQQQQQQQEDIATAINAPGQKEEEMKGPEPNQ